MKARNFFDRISFRSSSSRRRARRPLLEPLEGRAVPAQYTAATVSELIGSINAANASPEADSIRLTASVFNIDTPVDTGYGSAALPTIAANGSLAIQGGGAEIAFHSTTTNPRHRIFDVAPGALATLNDLTLSGGISNMGGALHNEGNLEMNRVTLKDNEAHGLDDVSLFRMGTSAKGGAVYSTGVLEMNSCVLQNNKAVGGNGAKGIRDIMPGGGPPSGTPGGDGMGGGLYVAGGSVVLADCTFSSNTAQGGDGGPGTTSLSGALSSGGGPGGDAFGAGLFIEAGSVQIQRTTATGNRAIAGAGGNAKKGLKGDPGIAEGGGISISPGAVVTLDFFTTKNVKNNKATTRNPNIAGDYTLIS